MSIIAIVILCICIAVLFYLVGQGIADHTNKKMIDGLENQVKHLIKTYNEDTARLHEDKKKLADRNLELSEKIRSVESDLINYKTKYKSTKSNLDKVLEAQKTHCKKHCRKEQASAETKPEKKTRKTKAK